MFRPLNQSTSLPYSTHFTVVSSEVLSLPSMSLIQTLYPLCHLSLSAFLSYQSIATAATFKDTQLTDCETNQADAEPPVASLQEDEG